MCVCVKSFCMNVRDASVRALHSSDGDSHLLKTPSVCRFHFFVMLRHARGLLPCTCFLTTCFLKNKLDVFPRRQPLSRSRLSSALGVDVRRETAAKRIRRLNRKRRLVRLVHVVLLVSCRVLSLGAGSAHRCLLLCSCIGFFFSPSRSFEGTYYAFPLF